MCLLSFQKGTEGADNLWIGKFQRFTFNFHPLPFFFFFGGGGGQMSLGTSD